LGRAGGQSALPSSKRETQNPLYIGPYTPHPSLRDTFPHRGRLYSTQKVIPYKQPHEKRKSQKYISTENGNTTKRRLQAMLNFNQKNNIGISYVLDLLKLSPLGKRRLRTLLPFTRTESSAFDLEMDNLSAMKNSFKESRSRWEAVRVRLKGIKDIIATALKCKSGAILSEPEFFEIKVFSLECSALKKEITTLSRLSGIKNVSFMSLESVIAALDPANTRNASFEVSSLYSDELMEIREEKRAVELGLREKPDDDALKAHRTRIVAAERSLEQEILAQLSREISEYADAIISDSLMLGYIDLLIEKAVLADEWQLERPVLSDKIAFRNMINPMVMANLEEKGRSFTPLSIKIKEGCTIISGANMSGKSVALKTVALNLYLASTGFFPFAERSEVILFDDIITVSEDLEDSERGLSSFGGEIVKLNECISASENGFIVLFMDEFARGTNPSEGTKIARATARFFNERECVCLMTTHFDTVADVASAHYQVKGLSGKKDVSCVNVGDIASMMDYSLVRVTPDKPVAKEAVKVCRLLGLNDELMELIEKE